MKTLQLSMMIIVFFVTGFLFLDDHEVQAKCVTDAYGKLIGFCSSPAGGTPISEDASVSPLQQFKDGIVMHNINCKEDFVLISKTENNFPACVKPYSILRLADIRWGYPQYPFTITTDILSSTISGAQIIEFHFDTQSASIIIKTRTTSDGNLTVTIPKVLTNLMSWYDHNKSHGVLVNGLIVNAHETNSSEGSIFQIPFANGTKVIEIVGTHEGCC